MPVASEINDKEMNWKRVRVPVLDRRTGVHTGAPPVAEVGSTGYAALELEQGDIVRQMIPVPYDVDPEFPIGLTALVCSGSVTVGDLLTLDLLYEVVALGGAAFPTTINDAPATDFPTVNPTATAFATKRTRAVLAADILTPAQVKNGAHLAIEITATDLDCDTNASAEGFFILELELDYVPRKCGGDGIEVDRA